jgi:hypothetical protein
VEAVVKRQDDEGNEYRVLIQRFPWLIPPWCPGFEENPNGGGDAVYRDGNFTMTENADGTYTSERRID